MILTTYFNHLLLSRVIKYILLATVLLSIVESVERLLLLPVTLTFGQNLAMWVLSWPMYTSLLLPACFYSALLATTVNFSHSQELAIMQMYIHPWVWHRNISFLAVVLAGVVFVTSGWIGPWSQGVQKDFAQAVLNEIKMPRTFSGQFNKIDVGGKKIVVYKDKKKNKGLFVATALKGGKGLTVMTTKKINVVKEKGVPTLTFFDGHSYTFDENDGLKYALSFGKSQVPLDIKAVFGSKFKYMQMQTGTLLADGSKAAHDELAWRVHLAVSVVILGCAGMILLDYITCRHASTVMYSTAGLVAVIYYVALISVKLKAGVWENTMQVHGAYGVCHLGILLLCGFLVKATRIVRVWR